MIIRPGRLSGEALTVRELIAIAYGLLDHQITGGPSWTNDDRYEILATMKPDASNAEVRGMLRTMLASRFGLAAHLEARELPTYLLRLGEPESKPGPQLRRSGPECARLSQPPTVAAPPAFVPAPPPPQQDAGRQLLVVDEAPARCMSVAARFNGIEHWSVREATMAAFAKRLTLELRRPVLDETKLPGMYDLDLTFTSDAAALVTTAPGVPLLPTALREQLGLRLDSTRRPVDVLVIDQLERPQEN